MSKKKEKKIKNLKRKGILPRIIGMIITDCLILSGALLLGYLAILGIVNNRILDIKYKNEKILQLFDSNQKVEGSRNQDYLIGSFVRSFSEVKSVAIFNSELKFLYGYGSIPESVEEIIPNINLVKKSIDKNGFFKTEIEEDNYKRTDGDNDDLLISVRMDNYIMTFLRSLNFMEFAETPEALRWGSGLMATIEQWTIYKTENPDIYVGIQNSYGLSNYNIFFMVFLGIIIIWVVFLCFVYGIIRLVSFSASANKIDLLVSTDTVTGGKNKDWFIEKAHTILKYSSKTYAIVQIRMEKYRNYCTSFGVKEGENLLESFSNSLESLMQSREISAHLENSSFVLLLRYEKEESLVGRINSIIKALSKVRSDQHLTFTAGIAKVAHKKEDIASLLSASGLALSTVNVSTENIVWFTDSLMEDQIWERHIEDDMEHALENHEFVLYLQPKYSTKGEQLAAAEALVRWIHPQLGFISPGKFIPIFENNGFILKLDDYMLRAVASQQEKWMAEGKKLVPISVNVSRAHFTRDDLAEHICKIVDEYKVPHEYIELELTESAFFDDKAVLLNTVKKLKSFGFAISMDDFGAGYSSLNSLKELPLDVIKLDAEFFRGIEDVNRANLIVGDTISLAKKLGMQIVAEGIETREQVDFLAGQNCDLIQGFYFAKPLPVSEFEQRAYPS